MKAFGATFSRARRRNLRVPESPLLDPQAYSIIF